VTGQRKVDLARSLRLLAQSTWPVPAERCPAALFETVVEQCLTEGLVGSEGFAVDASLIARERPSLLENNGKMVDIVDSMVQ
jgi:hypothetical protein